MPDPRLTRADRPHIAEGDHDVTVLPGRERRGPRRGAGTLPGDAAQRRGGVGGVVGTLLPRTRTPVRNAGDHAGHHSRRVATAPLDPRRRIQVHVVDALQVAGIEGQQAIDRSPQAALIHGGVPVTRHGNAGDHTGRRPAPEPSPIHVAVLVGLHRHGGGAECDGDVGPGGGFPHPPEVVADQAISPTEKPLGGGALRQSATRPPRAGAHRGAFRPVAGGGNGVLARCLVQDVGGGELDALGLQIFPGGGLRGDAGGADGGGGFLDYHVLISCLKFIHSLVFRAANCPCFQFTAKIT